MGHELLPRSTRLLLGRNFLTFSRKLKNLLLTILVNVGAQLKEFRKVPTLLLQAVDINGKDISSVLAQVLLKPKALIYIETDNLTGKAVARLTRLLEDMKNLFDDRVWIILFSENESSEKFASVT